MYYLWYTHDIPKQCTYIYLDIHNTICNICSYVHKYNVMLCYTMRKSNLLPIGFQF